MDLQIRFLKEPQSELWEPEKVSLYGAQQDNQTRIIYNVTEELAHENDLMETDWQDVNFLTLLPS